MQIIDKGNQYEVMFDYNPHIVSTLKKIPYSHRYYNASKKTWYLTKGIVDVDMFVSKYQSAIKQGVEEVEQSFDIPELPELNIEIPLLRKMFPFQERGVAQALNFKRLIIGDKPGLGKTTQAIAAAVGAKGFPCLIICPSTLKQNWANEWEIVAGKKAMILKDSVKNTWPQYIKMGMADVVITNFESLRKYFVAKINKPENSPLRLNHIEFKPEINLFKLIIVDESHKCKDGSTQQAKFVMGIAKSKEYVFCLSGTPVVNKPKDLLAQLHIINRLADFGGYKQFVSRYCGTDGNGSSNLKELNWKLSTTCFYQRQKQDVLKDLPDKMRQIVICDITTRKEYNEALNDLANYLKEFKNKTDSEVQKSMAGEVMVKIGVCKDISARGKLNEVTEFIDEVTEAGEKIVVFIHQKSIAEALLKHYPHAVSVRGADSMEERQNAITSFQNNPNTKIIICSIKAAGVGITLTASSRVAFVELPWHAADCDQCEDRCHRIGQKGSVQCTYFLGKDTIDEYIYEIIESKRTIADTVTGSNEVTQKEIIDKVFNSLFNKDNQPQEAEF